METNIQLLRTVVFYEFRGEVGFQRACTQKCGAIVWRCAQGAKKIIAISIECPRNVYVCSVCPAA